MHGQGGWKGWANDPAAGARTSSIQARSAPNSVDILGASDLVHEYSGYSSGSWVYTAWQYVPTDYTGQSYFILLNTYVDVGTNNWSVQVQFDAGTNLVVNEGATGGTLDLAGATVTNFQPVAIESGRLVNGSLSAQSFTKTGPSTATLTAAPVVPSPEALFQSYVRTLAPVGWYDPSDSSAVTLNGAGRVVALANKGTRGAALDAAVVRQHVREQRENDGKRDQVDEQRHKDNTGGAAGSRGERSGCVVVCVRGVHG